MWFYYYGEDNNITSLFGKKLPAIPEGYNYDFINADALFNLLSVKMANSLHQAALVIVRWYYRNVFTCIEKNCSACKDGATIAGIKPENTPSLSDDETTFRNIVNEVWSSLNTKAITGKSLSEVLSSLNIAADFSYNKPQQNTKLMYVHRKLSDHDIYWVNSRNDTTQDVKAIFRIEGKVPELWHAETGKTEAASYSITNGVTKVDLHLSPNDAEFVIFKDKALKTSVTLPATIEKSLITVGGTWKVDFQKDVAHRQQQRSISLLHSQKIPMRV